MIELTLPWPPSTNTCAGIYRIDDVKSGCFYIGSAVDLRQRFKHHVYSLQQSKHSNRRLQRVWDISPNRLTFTVIREMPGAARAERLKAEQELLDASNVGKNKKCFNMLAVAGSHQGAKRSEETKARISASQIGRTFSDETKAKMRAAKLGKMLSEEHKKNLGNSARGRKIMRPKGIVNNQIRALTPDAVRELRVLRKSGLSWAQLSRKSGVDLSACRRAVLGITYKDVK